MKVDANALWEEAVRRRKVRWARAALHQAKHRAAKRGLPFNITFADIETPDRCPIALSKLNYFNTKRDMDSPSLERYNPELGWVKGNIITVSYWISSVKGGRGWGVFEPEAERILAEAIKRELSAQAEKSGREIPNTPPV